MNKTLPLLLVFCFSFFQGVGQSFSLVSWNIQDLGRTKDADEIHQMAQLLRKHDLIAIQEVVAKDPAGARAVAWLADELNRMGARWEYRVSNPTQSPSSYSSERYAFLWKSSKLSMIGRANLDLELVEMCWREPYVAQFRLKGKTESFYVVNAHVRTHNQGPEQEIAQLVRYPERLESTRILIAGDYNIVETHPSWNPLYAAGFVSTISNAPTTLKRKCASGSYLNYAIDNIFYHPSSFSRLDGGRIDFVKDCKSLSEARSLSDHLPVFLQVSIF